ncbi:MAG: oxidative damage protection protein [Syntrophobacteraceae bacterium]|nr:oxidative damage protection protein [Syntrophobacteraceae bacterium]
MARMVNCVKLGRELPGLEKPPYPGELGQRIYDNVSQQAWEMWLQQATILLNHYGLSLADDGRWGRGRRAFPALGRSVEDEQIPHPEGQQNQQVWDDPSHDVPLRRASRDHHHRDEGGHHSAGTDQEFDELNDRGMDKRGDVHRLTPDGNPPHQRMIKHHEITQ